MLLDLLLNASADFDYHGTCLRMYIGTDIHAQEKTSPAYLLRVLACTAQIPKDEQNVDYILISSSCGSRGATGGKYGQFFFVSFRFDSVRFVSFRFVSFRAVFEACGGVFGAVWSSWLLFGGAFSP